MAPSVSTNGTTGGTAAASSPAVPKGIWCPAVTFFDPETDELDLVVQKKYYAYLASTGLAGLVILGTNAETFLLTTSERKALIKTAREAVPEGFPLMAGVSGHSTRQVLEYISDAVEAGADYALVLPPAYFGKVTTPAVIESFYEEVATKSPLPVIIYNFPVVCNGIDLDSDIITKMAKKNRNIVGVKLTCGSVAKIVRLAAAFKQEEFIVFGGQSDFLIGGLASGSGGCIAAFANVFPRTLVRIYEEWNAGNIAKAMELHRIAAMAETPCKSGIAVTKYAVSVFALKKAGIEGSEDELRPRRPYEPPTDAVKNNVKVVMAEIADLEASFSK